MDNINYTKHKWIHPFENGINIIDVLNSLYERIGVKGLPSNSNTQQISKLIPYSNKYVFILIDGMGYSQMKDIFSEEFLMKQTKLVMNTVFPSSTGTVLTTVATSLPPQKHSINGWFSYSKKFDESFTTLPFKNRFDFSQMLNTSFEDVFFCDQIFKNIPIKTDIIVNKSLSGSPFSRWSVGGKESLPYSDLANAFSILQALVAQDDQPSFTFLYAGEYDSTCHKYGTKSVEATTLLHNINELIENFSKVSNDKCTTVVVADHGLTDISPENFYVLLPDDKMFQYFYAPPGGDARVTSFYINNNSHKEFEQEFCRRFDDKAVLLPISEVEKLNLLGNGVLSDVVKERFGDYLAIWDEGYAFKYSKEKVDLSTLDIGNHGGLSKIEIEVPLIIF